MMTSRQVIEIADPWQTRKELIKRTIDKINTDSIGIRRCNDTCPRASDRFHYQPIPSSKDIGQLLEFTSLTRVEYLMTASGEHNNQFIMLIVIYLLENITVADWERQKSEAPTWPYLFPTEWAWLLAKFTRPRKSKSYIEGAFFAINVYQGDKKEYNIDSTWSEETFQFKCGNELELDICSHIQDRLRYRLCEFESKWNNVCQRAGSYALFIPEIILPEAQFEKFNQKTLWWLGERKQRVIVVLAALGGDSLACSMVVYNKDLLRNVFTFLI
jgi:hypothetical protein